ncbi:hypothetical protein QF002_001195 [Paraburkholderia youngii]
MAQEANCRLLDFGYSEAQLDAIAAAAAVPVYHDTREPTPVATPEAGWHYGHPGVLSSAVQARAIERALSIAESGHLISTTLPPSLTRRPIARVFNDADMTRSL